MQNTPSTNLICYKLKIAYDGTHYCGWQNQPNGVSIQSLIEKALSTLCKNAKIPIIGSGRTDAGVHAKGQIAHFHIDRPLDCFKIQHALNSLLPNSIRILEMKEVSNDFHARYSAIGKEYHYLLYLDKVVDPFIRHYVWHVKKKLDPNLLKQAAECFVGTHDFTSFANETHAGPASKNPVRIIYRLDVVPFEGGIRLEFEGNGFLYKMVRNIVGTIVDAASEKFSYTDIATIFAAKDRKKASQAAPPEGLFLINVNYER